MSSVLDDGLFVNVNGSAGQVTRDPITGELQVEVNTSGKVPAQLTGTQAGFLGQLSALPKWVPLLAVALIFFLILGGLGRKK